MVHSCFQWILTLYGILIKNPMGVAATILGILRNPRCEELQKRDDQHLTISLVISGRYPVPMEVRTKALVQRIDLKTTHEEADVIIPLQVVALADMGCKRINVICDDKYVFVIIAYFFAEESL